MEKVYLFSLLSTEYKKKICGILKTPDKSINDKESFVVLMGSWLGWSPYKGCGRQCVGEQETQQGEDTVGTALCG
jgi:hypothetical protein